MSSFRPLRPFRLTGLGVLVPALLALGACEDRPSTVAPEAARSEVSSVVGTAAAVSTEGIPISAVPDVAGTASAVTNDGWVFGRGLSPHFTSETSRRQAFVWRGSGSPEVLVTLDLESWVEDANAAGQAAGYMQATTGSYSPFVWDPDDGVTFINEPLNSRGEGRAFGITEDGDVAGWFLPQSSPTRSFYWQSGDFAAQDLEEPFWLVRDAAGSGLVVGGSTVWTEGGGFSELNGSATATNGTDFVGRVQDADGEWQPALVFPTAEPVLLGNLEGAVTTVPEAINADGWVVGRSTDADGNTRPFVWTPETGMVALGGWESPYGSAHDINDHGLIVGGSDGRAVMWTFDPTAAEDLPPEIETIVSQTATVGETLEVTPVVTDPEGDPFTLTWSGDVPENAIVNAFFSFTPTADQVGDDYVVTVTATQDDDPSLSDSESFVVSVLPADEPASADLSVSLAPALDRPELLGDEVTYLASVHNAGPDAVSWQMDVTLTHREYAEWGTVPEGDIVNGVFPHRPTGTIGPGETIEVPFGVVYGAFGVHEMTAVVTGDFEEADASDDEAVLDQIVDLPLDHPDVQTGSMTLPGDLTADGLPLAVVGIQVPGDLVVGSWPDVFLPASLTPDALLSGDQLVPADLFVPGHQFVPGDPSVPGDRFQPGDPLGPGDQFVSGDQFIPGGVNVPALADYDPSGRLIFADEDGAGTDAALTGRMPDGPAFSVVDEIDGGLRIGGEGGTAESLLELCDGGFGVAMDAGDAAIVTCGSLTVLVLSGEIRIDLADGTVVFVPADTEILITEPSPGIWDIEVLEGGPVDVVPPASFASLRDALDALKDDGTFNRGQHNATTRKVHQAGRLLERDKPEEAVAVLHDLRRQVLDLTGAVLTDAQADRLIALIDRLVNTLVS